MNLIEININGLFCKFNYDIPLKNNDKITILYGLNGHGKTTILRMVNAFFQKQFSHFMKIPFQSICFTFDNKQKITIYKNIIFLVKKSLNDTRYDSLFGQLTNFKGNNLIFESILVDEKNQFAKWEFFLFNGLYFEPIEFKNQIIETSNINIEKNRIRDELQNKEKITKLCQDPIEVIGFGEKFEYLQNFLESKILNLRQNLDIIDTDSEKSRKIFELNNFKLKYNKIRSFRNEIFHPKYRKIGEELFFDTSDLLVDTPQAINNINNEITSELIDSQRLLQFDITDDDENLPQWKIQEKKGKDRKKWTVTQCSDEIKNAIGIKNDEYASIAQNLDKTFPYRLLESIKTGRFEKNKIHSIESRLDDIYTWQKNLIKLGIFSENIKTYKKITTSDINRKDKTLDTFFQLYINDTTEKIMVFNELSDRLQKFVEIVDSLFMDKSLKFSKSEGMVFTDKITGVILKPDQLSSGEQHIVVVFFDLLFKFKRNSLILIDEPEISLHVSWQIKFVKYLQLISKLNNMSFVVSTHSPNIVYDREDLAVEIS